MRRLIAAFWLFAAPATAQNAPNVVADIAPIRALIAQVMEGVGTPSQIIPTGASPHGYAMRPSEARALRDADLVVWVGPALTHWLEEPLDTLGGDATRLTLMDVAQSVELPNRAALVIEAKKAHGDEHAGHDHGDDHAGHDHGDDHAGHDHGDDHTGHDHGEIDPHGWLSPENATHWADAIAAQLSVMDPDNAAAYAQNLATLRAEISQATSDIAEILAPHAGKRFIVLHDAYQYFEAAFDVRATAFIVPVTGAAPGPARIAALRDQLAENPAVCAFTAPQENDALLRTALGNAGTRVVALDPLGDGEGPYADLLRSFANDIAACLAG